MKKDSSKPRVTVSIGKELSILNIASKHSLDPLTVKLELETALREHYFHFASKPISIEYDPNRGYLVRATSAVGMIVTPSFVLSIAPKIPELSIGKALGLAQESSINLLNINNKSLAKNAISDKSSYTTVDFLGFSLINAVLAIRNNGYARKFEEVIQASSKLKGDISFQETIASGLGSITPLVKEVEPSFDIYPNQVLKAALILCANNSSSSEIIEIAQMLLDDLREIKLLSNNQLGLDQLFTVFSLPRPDYDIALAYAKALLEGRLISDDSDDVFTAAFTLDMDKVFESYCSTQIKELILPEHFEVMIQQSFTHDMQPDIADKKIVPDIVIKDKRTGELVILDLKNKYSQLRDNGAFKVSNDDLYQLAYYAKTLKAKCCFVVFPGANPQIQYPLKSSESQVTYEQKRDKKYNEIKEKSRITVFQEKPVTIYSYTINLLGSLQNTKKSVASLCQLIIDI